MAWKPSQTDNNSLLFAVLVTTPPPNAPDYAFTAAQQLPIQFERFKQDSGLSNWQEMPVESGKVGGMSFLRICFQGTAKNSAKVQGYYYIAKEAD